MKESSAYRDSDDRLEFPKAAYEWIAERRVHDRHHATPAPHHEPAKDHLTAASDARSYSVMVGRAPAAERRSCCWRTTCGPTRSGPWPGIARRRGRRTSMRWCGRDSSFATPIAWDRTSPRSACPAATCCSAAVPTSAGRGPTHRAALPNLPLSLEAAGYTTYHHGKRGNVAVEIEKRFDQSRYLDDDKERTSGQPGKTIVDRAIRFLEAREESATRGPSSSTSRSRHRTIPASRPRVPRPLRPGADRLARELSAAAPVRQRRDDRPRRAARPVAADRGGGPPSLARLLRRDLGPRPPHRPADPGTQGSACVREHDHRVRVRQRAGDRQPRADGQAEPLRAQHESAAVPGRAGDPAGTVRRAGLSHGRLPDRLRPCRDRGPGRARRAEPGADPPRQDRSRPRHAVPLPTATCSGPSGTTGGS